MTRRLIRAMENPHVTMLGHLSGRLLLKRDAYPLEELSTTFELDELRTEFTVEELVDAGLIAEEEGQAASGW